ncbi:UBN2 domain-containing protein [Cephalotus follicularis]|uniref:UBN2 domain-containing protein n=1 Tax=Cephalotus follicularis TaxID=3775 RepID=A0A1Q3CXA9_CEPFO|nr:UBN2 domain-containing protein [Cephalotus follicularis]
MEIYLKSRDFRNWLSVKNGPHTPLKLNDKNELVSKPEDEWDEDDFRKLTIDNKALNIMLVSLDKTEYNLVRRCTSAHEVWKLLILTHEGTEQVKNAKLALLNRDYELFKMQPNESIKNLYNRLLGSYSRRKHSRHGTLVMTNPPMMKSPSKWQTYASWH